MAPLGKLVWPMAEVEVALRSRFLVLRAECLHPANPTTGTAPVERCGLADSRETCPSSNRQKMHANQAARRCRLHRSILELVTTFLPCDVGLANRRARINSFLLCASPLIPMTCYPGLPLVNLRPSSLPLASDLAIMPSTRPCRSTSSTRDMRSHSFTQQPFPCRLPSRPLTRPAKRGALQAA